MLSLYCEVMYMGSLSRNRRSGGRSGVRIAAFFFFSVTRSTPSWVLLLCIPTHREFLNRCSLCATAGDPEGGGCTPLGRPATCPSLSGGALDAKPAGAVRVGRAGGVKSDGFPVHRRGRGARHRRRHQIRWRFVRVLCHKNIAGSQNSCSASETVHWRGRGARHRH